MSVSELKSSSLFRLNLGDNSKYGRMTFTDSMNFEKMIDDAEETNKFSFKK